MPNGDVRVTDTRTLVFSRHVPLRLLGPLDEAVGRHQGDRRERSGGRRPREHRALPAVTGGRAAWPRASSGPTAWPCRETSCACSSTSRSTDATASFTVRYTAKGAAKRYTDTAQLYWQFVGADMAVEARDVSVTVHLPGGRPARPGARLGARAAVGHGHHRAGRQRGAEGRPAAAVHVRGGPHPVPGGGPRAAPQQPGAMLQQALAGGEGARRQGQPRRRWWARVKVVFWGLIGIGVPLAALVLVLVLYMRYGREPKTQFQAQYLRDIPQPGLPPALVGVHLEHGQRRRRRRHGDAARPGQPQGDRPRARDRPEGRALRRNPSRSPTS